VTDPFAQNDPNDPNPTTRMPLPGELAGTGLPRPSPTPARPAAPVAQAAPTQPPAEPTQPSAAPAVVPPEWPVAAPPAPAWRPVRDDPGRWASVIVGIGLVAVGAWFFAEHTLGLDLPAIRWSQLWPLILIVVGVWVVFGSRRGSR